MFNSIACWTFPGKHLLHIVEQRNRLQKSIVSQVGLHLPGCLAWVCVFYGGDDDVCEKEHVHSVKPSLTECQSIQCFMMIVFLFGCLCSCVHAHGQSRPN